MVRLQISGTLDVLQISGSTDTLRISGDESDLKHLRLPRPEGTTMPTTTPDFITDDVGLKIIIRFVLLDGTARDISNATIREIKVKKPQDTAFAVKAATFVTDGTDGEIEYPWIATDIDEVGHYKARGHIIEPGKDYQTDIFDFVVGD